MVIWNSRENFIQKHQSKEEDKKSYIIPEQVIEAKKKWI